MFLWRTLKTSSLHRSHIMFGFVLFLALRRASSVDVMFGARRAVGGGDRHFGSKGQWRQALVEHRGRLKYCIATAINPAQAQTRPWEDRKYGTPHSLISLRGMPR
jgi:hypothetical protein